MSHRRSLRLSWLLVLLGCIAGSAYVWRVQSEVRGSFGEELSEPVPAVSLVTPSVPLTEAKDQSLYGASPLYGKEDDAEGQHINMSTRSL